MRAYLGNYVYNNVASNLGDLSPEVGRGIAVQPARVGARDGVQDAAVPLGLLRRGRVVPPHGQHHARLLVQRIRDSRSALFGTVQNAFTIDRTTAVSIRLRASMGSTTTSIRARARSPPA